MVMGRPIEFSQYDPSFVPESYRLREDPCTHQRPTSPHQTDGRHPQAVGLARARVPLRQ